MTFEEFIIKKKINLAQFKTADPGLFSEFQRHYSQMGEKSFDHSKKFLFNKLRRTYHLKEEPKPVAPKEKIKVNEIASQAEPLISPTVEATVYTPRFRAGATAKPAQEPDKSDTEGSEKKPAYTPRFKAQPSKSPEASPGEEDMTSPTQPEKPGFKPRFKPGLTNTSQAKPAEETKNENPAEKPEMEIPADKPKPAYIPRFKAPITKPSKD